MQFAYSVPLGSEEIVLAQKLPAQMTQLAVIAQKIGGMQLSSPQIAQRREMPADGQTYIVGAGRRREGRRHGDVDAQRAAAPRRRGRGTSRWLLAADHPRRRRLGRDAAAPRRRRERAAQQLHARRDKLFAELAALEDAAAQGDPRRTARTRRGASSS